MHYVTTCPSSFRYCAAGTELEIGPIWDPAETAAFLYFFKAFGYIVLKKLLWWDVTIICHLECQYHTLGVIVLHAPPICYSDRVPLILVRI